MPVRSWRLVFAVFGVIFVAAACSEDKKLEPARAVEKSAAIAQGDAICQGLNADVATLVDQFKASHPTPSIADAREFFVTTLLPRIDRGVGDLHRIGEPRRIVLSSTTPSSPSTRISPR